MAWFDEWGQRDALWFGPPEPKFGDIECYQAQWLNVNGKKVMLSHGLPTDTTYVYQRKEIQIMVLEEWGRLLSLPDFTTRVPVSRIPDNSIHTQPSADAPKSPIRPERVGTAEG